MNKAKFLYQLVGLEYPHHLRVSTPLGLHSFLSKNMIHRFLPPPKILGQKPKSTTKVILTSHQEVESNMVKATFVIDIRRFCLILLIILAPFLQINIANTQPYNLRIKTTKLRNVRQAIQVVKMHCTAVRCTFTSGSGGGGRRPGGPGPPPDPRF